MTAPAWVADAVRDFGRAAGLGDFALSAQGVAAMRFENGVSLRFECAAGEMVVVATVPSSGDPAAIKRILAFSHPLAGYHFKVRSGWMAKSGRAVFAVRIAEGDVTQPVLNAAFSILWRIATEIGGVA